MGKTAVFLAAGLVVGAVAIVWLRPSSETASQSTEPSSAADETRADDYAALADRVAGLEDQVSLLTAAIDDLTQSLAEEVARTDSEAAARAATIRDIQQRLAVSPGAAGQGPSAGMPPGMPTFMQDEQGRTLVVAANGATLRISGPNDGPLTAEAVAAAAASGAPLIAPANLSGVQATTGQTLVFRVTGSTEGTVWGSDVYTDDSSIGAAAVHAGLLRPGETGTLMLTVQNGYPAYSASSRNGIESENYGEWQRSFTMLRLN
jgi:hypothetical protein